MSVAATITHRTCTICDRHFQTLQGNRKYCSDHCTKVAGRVLSSPKRLKNGEMAPPYTLARCKRCKTPFATQQPGKTRCPDCRKSSPNVLGYAPVSVPPAEEDWLEDEPEQPLVQQELACVRCAHWVSTPGAELGFSCVVGQFTRCKPYQPDAQPLRLKD